ncbi:MAG: hypothetical protein PVH00_07730, partial [Gemmatimonadota bacterium]
SDYREDGYHPDAIVNYLSLLSWSSASGEEVLSRERLIEEVSLERMGASDVVFDPDKLRWLSARHIERMPLTAVVAAVRTFLTGPSSTLRDDVLAEAVEAVRSRLSAFSEIRDAMGEFYPPAESVDPDASAMPVLEAAIEVFASLADWDRSSIVAALKQVSKRAGRRGAGLYVPLRRALTGRDHGPALPAVLRVQGKQAVLQRLADAAAAARTTG